MTVDWRKTLPSFAVAVIIVGAGNLVWDFVSGYQRVASIASVQVAPPQEWFDIHTFHVESGERPIVEYSYQVMQPVRVSLSISPRNIDTGETICSGRALPQEHDPGPVHNQRRWISALVGMPPCSWPPGRYTADVTWQLTDVVTGADLKRIVIETNEFTITGSSAVPAE